MTNAIVVPTTFNGQVAAVFAGQQAGDDLSGGITGGYGLMKYKGKVWSVQYHGNTEILMRDDGDGPRGSIDVVIVKANAQLSKTFYVDGYDEGSNNPPDCASANGIVPDNGVPKKQNDICATCPKNAWGSAPGGGKGKACGDHRRMAIVPLVDLRNEAYGGPLLLRCPAASLQDMAAFDARYKQMGYPYFSMGIKIGFDAQESFPKFTFNGIRPLTNEEALVIAQLRDSPEVARVVNEGSAPVVVHPARHAQQPAFSEGIPANAVQPITQQVQLQPVAQPAPQPVAAAPTPAPVVQPVQVAQPAPQPHPTPAATGERITAGGFGPAARVQPAPAIQQQPVTGTTVGAQNAAGSPPVTNAAPRQIERQIEMTGFGGVTAEGNPQQAQPVVQQAPQPAPVSPALVNAFEGSIDDRLNALLAGNA